MRRKGFYTIPKGIIPIVILTVRLDFKLAYYDVTIQQVIYYITGTPTFLRDFKKSINNALTEVRRFCFTVVDERKTLIK